MTVAALYVDPHGVYANLPDVDLWDEARDARLYAGPWPVVAHPPCTRWCILGISRGYYDGEDGGIFEDALAKVRAFGGVLEHPAYSLAWKRYGLARPMGAGWTRSLFDDGWTCEVDQAWYGHECNKRTWLYAYGVELPEMTWGRAPSTGVRVNDAGSAKNDRRRSRTPPAFRDVLLAMARSAASPAHTEQETRVGDAA